MKRTTYKLAATAAAGALIMTACSTGEAGAGQDSDDKGSLVLLSHPAVYSALGGDTVVEEFIADTGINVEVVTAEIGPHLDKLTADYRAKSATFDVVALQNIDYMPRITDGLEALDEYIEQSDSDWDWEDFIPTLAEFAAVDDTQYGVPVRLGTQMLYYRQDLLDKHGLSVPETFDEFKEAARILNDDVEYGAVQRGLPRELANDWLGFLSSAGGELLTEDGTCGLESDEATEAANLLVDLYQEGVLPKDLMAWGRDEYISAMQKGNAGLGVYYSPYWGFLVNEEDSEVADSMAYAVAPVAEGVTPGQSRAQVWNLSIPSGSDAKDSAWEFITYVTNKDNSVRSALDFGNGPTRTSTYENSDYLEAAPVAEAWQQSAEVAQVDPPIDQLPQIVDILSEWITAAIDGSETTSEALQNACTEIDAIL